MSRFRYTVYHIICLQARGKTKNPFLKNQIRKKVRCTKENTMKIFMSRINSHSKVSDAQIATKDGKIVCVRMCFIHR